MKHRSLTAAALMSLAIAPAARAASLEPSLRPFAPVAAPMPDFRGVKFYQSFPTAGGEYLPRTLSGGSVRQWFMGLDRTQPAWSKLREQLDTTLGVYKDTVEEEGGALIAATAGTSADDLIAFNGQTNGRVMSLLDEYRDVMGRAEVARASRAAAEQDVNAAIAEAEAVAQAVRLANSEDELFELGAERNAIQEKAHNATWVQSALKEVKDLAAAVKSPQAFLAYTGEKLAGGIDEMLVQSVLNDNWERLTAIADREEELRKIVTEAKAKGRAAEVAAAQSKLAAARTRLLKESLERTVLFVQAWTRLDELAALERSSKRTSLFVALQSYNDHVHTMARAVRDGGVSYLFRLDTMPSASTDRLLAQMNADITDVQDRHDDQFAEWLEVAQNTRSYVYAHRSWYLADRQQVEQQIAAFQEGAHFELVRATVVEALTKLGSTL